MVLVTYKGNVRIKKLELEQQLKRETLTAKRKLFSDFLSAANKAGLKAFDSKEDYIEKLEETHGLLAEIEMTASKDVFSRATAICEELINMYSYSPESNAQSLAILRKNFVESAKSEMTQII